MYGHIHIAILYVNTEMYVNIIITYIRTCTYLPTYYEYELSL